MDFKSVINKLTIYRYMSAFLVILTLVSVFFYDFGINALIPVLIAVLTTAILDLIINYLKFKTLEFPYSAFISGLFIGGILTQNLPWYIYTVAGIIAILSKHLLNAHHKHILNPANFGILMVFLIFNAKNSWWISSPFYLVVFFGLFILWKLRRFDLATSFLVAYYILHAAFDKSIIANGMPMTMHNFYQSFISQSTIFFFAMFILIEPKTHPAARKQRIFYGILVAVMLVGIEFNNPTFGIPFVLAVANLFVPFLNRVSFEVRKKNI